VQTERVEVSIAISAAVEHLDFQIDAFSKTVVVAPDKVI
jgi:hypothetical protein